MKLYVKTLLLLLFTITIYAQDKSAAVFSTEKGAIKGYDPVAYFNQSKAVEGQADIFYSWNGAEWHFSSNENKEAFIANPEKYAPQYGGWCAFGWSKGYPAKIDPNAWSIVDEKLYLNYNNGVKKRWTNNSSALIESANENYQEKHSK